MCAAYGIRQPTWEQAGGILRGPNASTAQHPLVCRVGGEFLPPGRPSRAVSPQSPAARRHREAFRALASAPRAAESRAAGPALSADPAHATHAHLIGLHQESKAMNVRPLHDRLIIQRLEE